MSRTSGGRGGSGRGSAGRPGRGGRTSGGRQPYRPTGGGSATKASGSTISLGSNIFSNGQKDSSERLLRTWEKIVETAGTKYGADIARELKERKTYEIPKPEFPEAATKRLADELEVRKKGLTEVLEAKKTALKALTAQVSTTQDDPFQTIKIAELKAAIELDEKRATTDPEPEMTREERNSYERPSRTIYSHHPCRTEDDWDRDRFRNDLRWTVQYDLPSTGKPR